MGLQANSQLGSTPPAVQFVLLRHDCAESHWDLMIEIAGEEKLWTWQITADPGAWALQLPARRLADHRRIYLTYEGEISNNRGTVTRVDQGPAEVLSMSPHVRLRLSGQRVRGDFTLLPPG